MYTQCRLFIICVIRLLNRNRRRNQPLQMHVVYMRVWARANSAMMCVCGYLLKKHAPNVFVFLCLQVCLSLSVYHADAAEAAASVDSTGETQNQRKKSSNVQQSIASERFEKLFSLLPKKATTTKFSSSAAAAVSISTNDREPVLWTLNSNTHIHMPNKPKKSNKTFVAGIYMFTVTML